VNEQESDREPCSLFQQPASARFPKFVKHRGNLGAIGDVGMSKCASQRSADVALFYDFDPRTPSQKSDMTQSNQCRSLNGWKFVREEVYVVCANPRRAEIVWRL
jgi:hypothetical protein